jgi:hypothetical protein
VAHNLDDSSLDIMGMAKIPKDQWFFPHQDVMFVGSVGKITKTQCEQIWANIRASARQLEGYVTSFEAV